MTRDLVALDLFAGTGWGVACRRLGILEHGVEFAPIVIATRTANGMRTAYENVWDGLEDPSLVPAHTLQIGSPPCQPFSPAGRGDGRDAFGQLVQLLEEGVYRNPRGLRALTGEHTFSEKTALILAPLAYAYQWRPTFIAWEQVPTALPVWEAAAEQLRLLGYSVATGIVYAEQYGVPQTRRRAILVARNDGPEARLPTPTHSRYYPRTPDRLDPGVERWVTMAEALGWGFTARPSTTLTGHGIATRQATGTKRALVDAADAGTFTFRPPFTAETAEREGHVDREDGYLSLSSRYHAGAINLDPAEASVLQTYPAGPDLEQLAAKVRARANDQSGTPYDAEWPSKRPALTIAGRGLVPHPGATANRFNGSTKSRNDGIRIEPGEAAAIQSYPHDFVWCGNQTQQFLQIGNAVPPLLAEHVLAAITADHPTTPPVPADVASTSHDDELPIFDLEGATP